MKSPFPFTPWIFAGASLLLATACSSNNPDPSSGSTTTRTKGRVIVSSETGSSVHVIDLEQALVEDQAKAFSNPSDMMISPEGQFALMVQTSGNRVDFLKMGTSVTTTSDTTTETDGHEGHNHKPRFASGHDHDDEANSSETSTSDTSSTSSVDSIDLSITGQGLGHVIARGAWISIQLAEKVIVISEENLENKINSINESLVNEIAGTLPGVPMDEEHIAIGNKVYEIEDASVLHSGSNLSANNLMSSNILSATRSGEGTALFGTDQGLLVVGKHTESGNTEWEDFMIPYPTPSEVQIFLAEEHDHEEEEAGDEEHDEHEEVAEHRVATQWATLDGLGHAFAHLTHEDHSAGVYLVEAEGLEPDGDLTSVFEYLDGTSSATSKPMEMTLVKLHEEEEHHEDEEEEEEHEETTYLLILMSSGNLRLHDASNEGAYLRTLSSVINPITDFHAGENNLPGLTAGLGKVFIGDPSNNEVHQIDLDSFKKELTWSLDTAPNRLLLMGESTLGEASDHDHDHD